MDTDKPRYCQLGIHSNNVTSFFNWQRNLIVIYSYTQSKYGRRMTVCAPSFRSDKTVFITFIYDGWNFNSGNYLFTTDTK